MADMHHAMPWRAFVAAALVLALGGLVHVAAAVLGLSVVIAQSALAFGVLKYLGAAYLVYLGLRMLLQKDTALKVERVRAQGAWRALVDGIVVEALNVKAALFFLAFLPQFTTPGVSLALQLGALGAVCVALNTAVDVLAVRGFDRWLRAGAAREGRTRRIARPSGCTMVGLGAFPARVRREG